MVSEMTLIDNLRTSLVELLAQGTWTDIKEAHKEVQLGWREDLESVSGKWKYVTKVVADLDEGDLVSLGERCINQYSPKMVIKIQDALWSIEVGGNTQITDITRLAIADKLDGRKLHPREDPETFLSRFGVAESLGMFGPAFGYGNDGNLVKSFGGFEAIIDSNADKNYETSNHLELLELFGFQSWPDKRVFQFLEALVHPTTRKRKEQEEWVVFINELIAVDGFVLKETDCISGHPLFSIQRLNHGVGTKPKNLIFASIGPKPELGFQDAISNEITVLKNAEHCLFYEDSISDDGLVWEDLVNWWAAKNEKNPTDAGVRRDLGARLRQSLGSEPERNLFEAYFRIYKPLLEDQLPALIPQVYLHYDPITLKMLRTRGEDKRFLSQRMDFLLLLPERARVVLEIDGRQHYSEGDGDSAKPSPRMYANMVQADRELRLRNYEVYRFGGYELRNQEIARAAVKEFIDKLFRRHGIIRNNG